MNNYSRVRIGIAGATGYSGVELLRRLATHPGADVRLAMGSSASEAKRVPSLKRIWDDPVERLTLTVQRQHRLDTLAAEIGPALAKRGRRVFDLSGAFRLRDQSERER